MMFLPNILLFQVLSREDMVGYLGVLFSGLTIAMGYYIGRFAKEHHGRRYLLIAGIGMAASGLLLLFQINLLTVIGFMVIFSLFNPLQGNSLSTYFYSLIGKLPMKGQMRVETIVLRETFLNLGRVISIFVLISFAHNVNSPVLPYILAGLSILQIGMVFLVTPNEEGL
jgi:YQGE family putative transporter